MHITFLPQQSGSDSHLSALPSCTPSAAPLPGTSCLRLSIWLRLLQKVLICGFGLFTFMVELMRALDAELPSGSEVVLFSQRTTRDTVGEPPPMSLCASGCEPLLP